MAFTAIELLGEASQLSPKIGKEIILLLNSEEEVGSPISRPITEKLAQECSAVYVLEPAQGLAYKTSRKGTGNWRLTVQGIAAHAGVDFTKGRSAILELTRQIEKVSGWTDLARGLTVNVGVIGGGSKSNVIPAEAWAEIDLRVARRADGPRMESRFAKLKPAPKSGTTLQIEGGINRPPMERTRGTRQALPPRSGIRERSRLDSRRSLNRRRLRRQLYLSPRYSHPRRHGRSRRRSPRQPRVDPHRPPGPKDRSLGRNADLTPSARRLANFVGCPTSGTSGVGPNSCQSTNLFPVPSNKLPRRSIPLRPEPRNSNIKHIRIRPPGYAG